MIPDRVHILGASGSGTTTLGKALAARLEFPHYDTDDYFWIPTDPPFQEKRDSADRQHLLRSDLACSDRWVLSGSLCGWGDVFIPMFTLVVVLWVPPSVRLAQLRSRERLRYGDDVLPGGPMHEAHLRFLDWTSAYDTGGMDMRSRQRHEVWLANLSCPVVRIEGDVALEDQARFILHHIVEPSSDRSRAFGDSEEG